MYLFLSQFNLLVKKLL